MREWALGSETRGKRFWEEAGDLNLLSVEKDPLSKIAALRDHSLKKIDEQFADDIDHVRKLPGHPGYVDLAGFHKRMAQYYGPGNTFMNKDDRLPLLKRAHKKGKAVF